MDLHKKSENRHVISKILKFDENNQYGFAMIQPLPTDCIKKLVVSFLTFNLLLESVSLDDTIGRLYVADIKFDSDKATKCLMVYNEIFLPIVEKDLILEPNERSCFQLLELYCETDENKPKTYTATTKVHSILFSKICIPLCLEDLKFLMEHVVWLVTKIYAQFTFEQAKYKKEFILMNQRLRQNLENKIEKDFYKLFNFRIEPIYDEIEEITYLRKYHSLLNPKISKFVNSSLIESEIQNKYVEELFKIRNYDPFRIAKISALKEKERQENEALSMFKEKEKRNKKENN